ncbi:hypothetical protein ND861_06355 [Leptospira sp. 2 VSF19]|uniref:GWxTD domain-containing protein n=1 Tax=Leptospira soteropolitanensis TaxID=2950025 RepID=A0AAW5VBU1_9LEPT|nr:hypothetical protein [Leptospira soteropolitanensis]MCW7492274.1 hypothetical protein [Leptospira soteropolitanensis]MCW7499856.1 hypothetical protein [Leptospira soteropolitanensis]MCW7522107.1 hypothetical protein [Leptospira soteropolitanensis]MCW7525961.1 hypothetical protein [Leptospira soteropolitanensis]MCW7529925.1 hypothetical protein [Leptospira soteropolitanensis]
MRSFRTSVILGIFLVRSLAAFPDRDARGERIDNFVSLQSKINLSLTKRSYQSGERIPLTFTVTNTGKEVVRIFPSFDFRFSFQIIVKDENDRILTPIEDPEFPDPVLKRRTTIVNLVGDENKEISLHRNESFSKTIYLDEHYSFLPDQKFYVTGYFYPNYTEDKSAFLRSQNTVGFLFQNPKADRKETVTRQITENGGLSPEETIFLFLGAEMKKHWEYHFKWIDFSEYILAYDRFSSAYTEAGVGERETIIEDFKEYLTETPSGVLKYFKVMNVDYPSKRDARVQVYVERMMGRFKTRYEYIYTLRQEEGSRVGFWQIKNLLVKVKK